MTKAYYLKKIIVLQYIAATLDPQSVKIMQILAEIQKLFKPTFLNTVLSGLDYLIICSH